MRSKPNKSFCPYPWVHLMTQPSGSMSWCCVARDHLKKENGTSLTLQKGEDTLQSAWNSPHMKKIRKQMLEGEAVEGCQHCYFLEEVGAESYRQSFTKTWMDPQGTGPEVERRIEHSLKNDFAVDAPPLYLDFRFGNLCNLKCRMCNPQNSSSIYQEFQNLSRENPAFADFVQPYIWGYMGEDIQAWWDEPTLLQNIEEWLPLVKTLYFTGGEPTLIQRNYWVMEKAIRGGHAQNIKIIFNTNCTTFRPAFMEALSHFKEVEMCASIDGMGKTLEYIRTRAKWEGIEKNLRKYARSEHIDSLLLVIVVQVYNILDLADFLVYLENFQEEIGRDFFVHLIQCDYPQILDIRILPQELKNLAIDRLSRFIKEGRYFVPHRHLGKNLEALIKTLEGFPLEHSDRYFQDFHQYSAVLDQKRKTPMEDYLPELAFHLGQSFQEERP